MHSSWPLCTRLSRIRRFFASVRLRLTLWYLATLILILMLLGWSLHNSQSQFTSDAIDSQVETRINKDLPAINNDYKQALLTNQSPSTQPVKLATRQFILLLRTDGTVLDRRGPLNDQDIAQLQRNLDNSQGAFNLTLKSDGPAHGWGWWAKTNSYRVMITPILQQNTRIAILMVGLPREIMAPFSGLLFMQGIIILLVSIIGGYWLAGKALRPVKMITRMANEINATDLRRRLHLKRRDEFGELAATFDQMLARLEASFKRQTQFTADASHELRTPLTIINLEVNRALTQVDTTEEYRQVLEHIQSENEQMTAIVNSLLLLARADTGRIEMNNEIVDLSDIALGSVERLLPLAQKYGITLATGELPELLVLGDAQHLSRAITNLVENAVKYTYQHGTRVHVTLQQTHERWALIQVQDDGPGIAEEHLPYLFDRFFRVDKARTTGQATENHSVAHEEPAGTGLGLAIAQWIVQAHHGDIRVTSTIGQGSIFEIRLPLHIVKMTNS